MPMNDKAGKGIHANILCTPNQEVGNNAQAFPAQAKASIIENEFQ